MVVEFLPANYAGADNFRTGGVGEAVHGAAGVDHAQAVGFAKGAGGIGGVAEMVVDYAFDDKQAIAGDAAGVAFEAFKAAGVVFAVFVVLVLVIVLLAVFMLLLWRHRSAFWWRM